MLWETVMKIFQQESTKLSHAELKHTKQVRTKQFRKTFNS